MIHKTGNTLLNTCGGNLFPDGVEIVQVIMQIPLPGLIIAYGVKSPADRTGSEMITEILKLVKALL